jgi:hypothetical protein
VGEARIVTMLKRADAALGMFGGGDAAPSVDRARQVLRRLWKNSNGRLKRGEAPLNKRYGSLAMF